MSFNPYQVTKDFEAALCAYTGAPFAVAVNSCSAALLLAVEWHLRGLVITYLEGWKEWHGHQIRVEARPTLKIDIPRRTYISVAQSIILAGGRPTFRDEEWRGAYQLKPLPVWDCACRFTSGMYVAGQFQCVSFAARKILGAEQGGAILHDNEAADKWFRKMRFDGRTEGLAVADDTINLIGTHCLMIPSVAATLLLRLHHLPKHNNDLSGASDYPDISKHPAFQ